MCIIGGGCGIVVVVVVVVVWGIAVSFLSQPLFAVLRERRGRDGGRRVSLENWLIAYYTSTRTRGKK